jgi:hypothetical protein
MSTKPKSSLSPRLLDDDDSMKRGCCATLCIDPQTKQNVCLEGCAKSLSSNRAFYTYAVTLFSLGVFLFIMACAYANIYQVSHRIRGYEFLPAFVMILSSFVMIRMPEPSELTEQNYNREINTRLIILLVLAMFGFFGGVAMYTFEWLVLAPHLEVVKTSLVGGFHHNQFVPNPMDARGLFSSASPTPKPKKELVPTPADPVTWALFTMQLFCYLFALLILWFTNTRKEKRDDDSFALY